MRLPLVHRMPAITCAVCLLLAAVPAEARILLKSICRVKGQEENVLQGLGIIVGLKGTGDGGNFQPTVRSLSKAMQFLGEPPGKLGTAELKDTKNVALVMVTATVPAAGARQGDKIDCMVSSIGSAKSLAGGRLFLTPLLGPDRNNPRVYALAEGPITIYDSTPPTTGRITAGCRLEEEFFNAFAADGRITLVLDKNHADFQVAQDVAELINGQLSMQSSGQALARALNQVNIEVMIPAQYRNDPVLFVSQVLALPMLEPQTAARVVINERAGSIVIGGDVEIGAAVVTHKNVVIETGGPVQPAQFVAIDVDKTGVPRLRALVESLTALRVPVPDIIEIIKGLDRDGKLHAQLIVE